MNSHRKLAAIIAVAAAVSSLLNGCAPSANTSSTSVPVHSGEDVRLATEGDSLVVEIPGAAIRGSGTLSASPISRPDGIEGWEIGLSGGAELVGDATIRFKHIFIAGEPAPLVTSMSEDMSLEVQPLVRIEADAAVVETTHFSSWFTMWWSDLLVKARKLMDTIYTDAGKQPTCNSEDAVRDSGFHVRSDDGKRVYWCLGLDNNGKPQLSVTNGRGYTVSAESTPGLEAVGAESTDLVGVISNAIKERPSRQGNVITLVGPGNNLTFLATGTGEMGVRVRPSVAGYLVTAAQYAVDTLAMILPYAGKTGLSATAISNLFNWESCLSGYSSMVTSEIETTTQAANYFNDAVGTTFGCLSGAIAKAGLGIAGTVLVSGVSWLVGGIRSALNGFGAAADTALNPSGYTIYLTAPEADVEGFPLELQGTWCSRSDNTDCFGLAALSTRFPELYLEGSSPFIAPGATQFHICLLKDLGSSCTTSASMFLAYFPPNVIWDCNKIEVEQGRWPKCDPDFTSAHDSSQPRIVKLFNHQQDENYHDSVPLYRTTSADSGVGAGEP